MPTNFDWDDNEFPLTYLITIRTHGTWLHGDERGSVDRHGQNIYGTNRIAANNKFSTRMRENNTETEFLLNGKQRAAVEAAIRNVCTVRACALIAVNVRTNHFHSVVAAANKPELIINAFKTNATRELRAAGLVNANESVWSRGGSRRYLWKPHHIEAAIDYVLYGQGEDLPNF